jgi:hypothetical protein
MKDLKEQDMNSLLGREMEDARHRRAKGFDATAKIW